VAATRRTLIDAFTLSSSLNEICAETVVIGFYERHASKAKMEMIVARPGKLLTKIAAFTVASLAYGSAMASTFLGEIAVGYSDNLFQIGQGTSSLVINVNAIGSRDPAVCAFCNSAYTDNFTVNLFDQAGTLLKSMNATNYLYYNTYSNSHGIGAGPVGVMVPAGFNDA
jgi:hypothetical protein